jgi:PAS domain S-box-containing protein
MKRLPDSQQTQFLNAWLQNTDDIVLFLNSDYRVTEYSAATLKYLGNEPDKLGNDFFQWCKVWQMDFSCLKSDQSSEFCYNTEICHPTTNIKYSVIWKVNKICQENHSLAYLIVGNSININSPVFKKNQTLVFESILNNFPGTIFCKDKRGVYLGCNLFTARLVGVNSPEEVIGKTDYELPWPRETTQACRANDEKVMMTGTPLIVEEDVTIDGQYYIFLSHKSPLKDKDNNIIGVLGIAIDITENKKREKDLERSEKEAHLYLKNIIKNLSGSIFWKDLEGHYLGCNQTVADLAGVPSPSDVIGKTDYDFCFSQEDIDTAKKTNDLVLQTGLRYSVEETATSADGIITYLLTQKGPLLNDNGEIIGMVSTSLDISDRKKLEKELAEAKKNAEAYLQNAVEQIPGEIYWKDKKGVYLGCNNQFAKRMGFALSTDMIGKTDDDLPWVAVSQDRDLSDKALLMQGVEQEFEETKQLPDGKECVYLTKKSPLRNEKGEVLGVIAISFDITERRAAEQERLDTLQSFGSIVAHELRTPLITIGTGAQAIQAQLSRLSDDQTLSAEEVLEQYQNVLTVTDNILFEVDAAGLVMNMILENVKVSKHFNSEFKACSMVQCVEHTLRRYPLAKKHQGLVEFDNRGDFTFYGDENLFAHILFNLIKNALYFLDAAGKGSIHIWLETTDTENILHFKDTGAGIAEEDLPKIFDRFYSRRYHGVGLGLAFCYLAMDKFHGNIRCESVEGEYTEFFLVFPVGDISVEKPE